MGNENNYKKEVDTGHAAQISESASEKLYNSIVRIEIEDKKGTGFFMKAKIKGKECNFLLTNFHVITQNDVDLKKQFNYFYGKKDNETKKSIQLDKNKRFIKCFPEDKEDVTVIEIIKNDKIPENKYLFPDLNYKNGFNNYLNENFYLAGYPKVDKFIGERHISSGKIIKVKDFQFYHNLDTRAGSSGSPICLLYNQNIIGIHRGGIESKKTNIGTFIGSILDELEKEDNKIEKNKKNFLNQLQELADRGPQKLSEADKALLDELFKEDPEFFY